MEGRLTGNDVTNAVNVEDPHAVRDAVRGIFQKRYPGTSFDILDRVFDDFRQLYTGRMPGYLACDTPYHDMRHSLDMSLAAARLIDGHDRVHVNGNALGPQRAQLGIIVALLHDAGYIREAAYADQRNGAVYTLTHVSRGARFLKSYLHQIGLGVQAETGAQIVHFTGDERPFDDILVSRLDRRLGTLLGCADLLAQMSDRLYLEKCRDFLYDEFVHAGLAGEGAWVRGLVRFYSREDLLARTNAFYERVVKPRMSVHLDAGHLYAGAHFGGDDPYLRAIEKHMAFLRRVVDTGDFGLLRRRSRSLTLTPVAETEQPG